MTKEHRYAYAGQVEWKNLVIEVYICEDCERIKTYKRRVFPIGL